MKKLLLLIAAAGLTLMTAPASAVQQAKSRYSTIDLAKCRTLPKSAETETKAWQCPGLPGYPLYVAVGHAQTYLSVGQNGQAHRAAQQSLDDPNTLFDGKSRRTAVEWRFVIRDKKAKPYATIVRYFTSNAQGRGESLIVTRVTDDEACQVARIDALASRDAMIIARRIADQEARQFDCRHEPTKTRL